MRVDFALRTVQAREASAAWPAVHGLRVTAYRHKQVLHRQEPRSNRYSAVAVGNTLKSLALLQSALDRMLQMRRTIEQVPETPLQAQLIVAACHQGSDRPTAQQPALSEQPDSFKTLEPHARRATHSLCYASWLIQTAMSSQSQRPASAPGSHRPRTLLTLASFESICTDATRPLTVAIVLLATMRDAAATCLIEQR